MHGCCVVGSAVYGSEPDDPEPGPRPGHHYVELGGGPLDGMLLDVTGWHPQEVVDGVLRPLEAVGSSRT